MIESEYTYDVAIIGAGPAGSSLAYFLAKSGFNTILVDKEKFPRKKVCAGGLPVKVLEILPFDISPVIEKEIREVTLTHRLTGAFTKAYYKPLMYTVNRERFDDFLAQEARTAGARFLEDQKIEGLNFEDNSWTVKTTDRVIKASVLVGADGANSFVARELSLRSSSCFHSGLQVEVPLRFFKNSDLLLQGLVLDWGRHKDSYGWIFPRRESVVVGVQGPVKMGKRLKLYLYDLLRHYGISPESQKLTGHLIPHRVRPNSISMERAILVGDASGSVDYWTGEGIFYGIKSSRIAADCIKEFFDGRVASLNVYEHRVDREVWPDIKTSYQFSKVFNYLSLLAFGLLRRYDYPWDVFCRIMRGDRTFSEVKRRFRPDILIVKLLFKSRRGGRKAK